MYDPGTKFVIMDKLLLRSAPGVLAISSRSTTVVGVDVSVGAVTSVAVTLMDSLAPATLSGKCSTGCEPETTITSCWICSKPTAATVTTYSPGGTALNAK